MEERLRSIGQAFLIPGDFLGAKPWGSGHIHETFAATYAHRGERFRYVLQRLNDGVFSDLPAVMENVVRVTTHLQQKLAAAGVHDAHRRCLRVIPTRDRRAFHVDAAGRVWRAYAYLEGTQSHDVVDTPARAREAARAFGAFAGLLSDLPPPPLAVTIPHFHDLPRRFAALEAAVRDDPRGRAAGLGWEIDRAATACERLRRRLEAGGADALPRRIVHNDCKINNVLFDARSGEGLCVIDLDTAMEDTLLSDFGELVRSSVCRSPEDEPRPERMRVELALFDAVALGYSEGASSLLGAQEIELFPLAGPLLALENAIRFLTDHLSGDVYFRIHREGQNAVRARAQLRLFELLAEQEGAFRSAVRAATARAANAGGSAGAPPASLRS